MINSIYKITNSINDKVYIGQTWRPIKKRFSYHKRENNCIKLVRAFEKYGKKNFNIELIVSALDQLTADYLERFWITVYDSIENGYNIREGGSRGRHSEETKKKMSIAAMGNKNGIGHKVSKLEKKRLSESKKGKTWKIIDGKRRMVARDQ